MARYTQVRGWQQVITCCHAVEATRDLLWVLNQRWQDSPSDALNEQVTAVSDALHLLKEARL